MIFVWNLYCVNSFHFYNLRMNKNFSFNLINFVNFIINMKLMKALKKNISFVKKILFI